KPEPLPAAKLGSRPAFTSWSPDGKHLAGEFRGRPGILVYSVADRDYRPITSSGSRPIWLPGGQEILFADAGRLRIVNVATGAIREVATPYSIAGMSLTHDARTLVYSERTTESDVWMMAIE
ncbi:MAG TPA: hypothetical protein VF111_02825, partial [Thermoanaerobaculia bacterium]